MFTCTCRLVLLVINIVFGLVGFLLMLAGALLTWGKSIVKEQVTGHLGPIIKQMYDAETAQRASHLADTILKFTAPFGLIIFGFGIAILILCIFGCCNKALCMKIYTALLVLIALAELTLLGFYYANRPLVFSGVRKILEQSLSQYISHDAEDQHSVIINVMMVSLNCCGLENGEEFKNVTTFNRIFKAENEEIKLEYPLTCCKRTDSKSGCPKSFDANNSNIKRGCWKELYPHLIYYGNLVALVGILVLLFQVLLITLCVFILAMKKF